jgi:hypothetical protein
MATDKTSKPKPPPPNSPVPTPAPAPDGEAPEKQDRSIKARKSSLFETHEAVESTRPFSEYVKTAPAAPLSLGVRATLIAIAVLVVALLLAAIFGAGNRRTRRRADATGSRPVIWVTGSSLRAPNRTQAVASRDRSIEVRIACVFPP